MKKKSVMLLGLLLVGVLCFGGCGKEQEPVSSSVENQSIASESVASNSSEEVAESSQSEEQVDNASETESGMESESPAASESVSESSVAEEDSEAYLEPLMKCMDAAVEGNMMGMLEAMPKKFVDSFLSGMKALGMTDEDIEKALAKEPKEGAADIQFRYGEATPKTAEEIREYSALLNDIAPMDVTEGYSVMVYAVAPNGEESGKSFDVYKVDGTWTLSVTLIDKGDSEDEIEEPTQEESTQEEPIQEEPEKEYTFDNFTTLEEYYKIPFVAKAIDEEMATVRESFSNVYSDCQFFAIENTIHYTYAFKEGVEANESNRTKLEEAFPTTANQLKSLMDSLETATGIRPDAIVCTYLTYDGTVIYEGTVE